MHEMTICGKKVAGNFKESKEGCMASFGWGKGRKKCCKYIILIFKFWKKSYSLIKKQTYNVIFCKRKAKFLWKCVFIF